MPNDKEYFRQALIGKKIPILTLDHQWHKLFNQTKNNEAIQCLANELNELLKLQGKYNSEIKSLNGYKKTLMQEIVTYMELPDSPQKESKMEQNKDLIEQVNSKIDQYKDLLLELPKNIDEKNFELMLVTLEICYQSIQQNTQEIEAINQWIEEFRNTLKKQVLDKQRKQIWNDEMYSYMHAIFGIEVIELFDMKYNPQNVLQKEDSE